MLVSTIYHSFPRVNSIEHSHHNILGALPFPFNQLHREALKSIYYGHNVMNKSKPDRSADAHKQTELLLQGVPVMVVLTRSFCLPVSFSGYCLSTSLPFTMCTNYCYVAVSILVHAKRLLCLLFPPQHKHILKTT